MDIDKSGAAYLHRTGGGSGDGARSALMACRGHAWTTVRGRSQGDSTTAGVRSGDGIGCAGGQRSGL